jgi:hypothetical protein
VGPEGVPRDCGPRLRNPKVCPVDGHQAVVVDIAFLMLFEVDLQCIGEEGEEGSRRVRGREYTRRGR